jgi:hypothetical protein
MKKRARVLYHWDVVVRGLELHFIPVIVVVVVIIIVFIVVVLIIFILIFIFSYKILQLKTTIIIESFTIDITRLL